MTYTAEEIEKLPASRELDMLVAKQVLGYDSRLVHVQAGGKMVDLGPQGRHHIAAVDYFSQSPGAAWDIVSKLHAKGCHVSVATAGLAGFSVTVVEPDPTPEEKLTLLQRPWPRRWQAGSENAALAICRAALLFSLAAPSPQV